MDTNLNLEFLEEYNRLSKIESAIKERKDEIKKYYKHYFESSNQNETPEYKGLVGKNEERVTYSLSPDILEENLPPIIFNSIVDKTIDLNKAKSEFIEGRIPIYLLRSAEERDVSYGFYVRKYNPDSEPKKTIPFWRV